MSRYRFEFERPRIASVEFSSLKRISTESYEEQFNAESDSEAVTKAIEVMKKHKLDTEGATYYCAAKSLMKWVDISSLRQSKAA